VREGLDEPVSVLSGYNKMGKFRPLIVTWNGMDYRLGKVDFYHKTKSGTTALHHFSVADKNQTVYFKLLLNASNLQWTLQEYMMGGGSDVEYTQSGNR